MKNIIIKKFHYLIDYPEMKFRLPALLGIMSLILVPSDGFDMSLCLFYSIFQIPCPACGLTRSMSSFLNFDILQSLYYHPLGSIVLIYLIVTALTNQPDFLRQKFQHKSVMLSNIFTFKFISVLFILAWIAKLIQLYYSN